MLFDGKELSNVIQFERIKDLDLPVLFDWLFDPLLKEYPDIDWAVTLESVIEVALCMYFL